MKWSRVVCLYRKACDWITSVVCGEEEAIGATRSRLETPQTRGYIYSQLGIDPIDLRRFRRDLSFDHSPPRPSLLVFLSSSPLHIARSLRKSPRNRLQTT